MTAIAIAVGVVLLLVVFLVRIYNRLVTLRNRYKNGFSQIDVQLKRRYDLIPNLVETAKAYLAHEKDTLQAVVEARNGAVRAAGLAAQSPGDPAAMQGLGGAETLLTGALGRFMAVVEQYPDLKANQTMSQLMEEMTSTENRVSFARQAYNDSVTDYNTSIEVFPNSLIAGMGGFQRAELLEIADAAEREPVKVAL